MEYLIQSCLLFPVLPLQEQYCLQIDFYQITYWGAGSLAATTLTHTVEEHIWITLCKICPCYESDELYVKSWGGVIYFMSSLLPSEEKNICIPQTMQQSFSFSYSMVFFLLFDSLLVLNRWFYWQPEEWVWSGSRLGWLKSSDTSCGMVRNAHENNECSPPSDIFLAFIFFLYHSKDTETLKTENGDPDFLRESRCWLDFCLKCLGAA